MKNFKFVAISSAAGFILSFFCGIFSHSKFIRMLLIALLFAIVFGILSILISFIYKKFLDIDNGDYDSPAVAMAGAGGKASVGGKVDIVISESELEQTGNSNRYYVGDHKQMLNPTDVNAAPVEEVSSNNGFVPLQKLETVSNFSGKEAVSTNSSKNSVKASSFSSKSLDELPDMGDLSFNANSDSSEDSEILSENSDFISSALKYKDDNSDNIQDASLMAKAISSILSEET